MSVMKNEDILLKMITFYKKLQVILKNIFFLPYKNKKSTHLYANEIISLLSSEKRHFY